MKRLSASLGSALFLVIAPGTVAVLVPWLICRWHVGPPLFGFSRMLGVVLIALGLPILLDSFARFALQGLGTPAPVAPPSKLVVTGLYRHVRNPMYVAVVSLILGQGLAFGHPWVLAYGALVFGLFNAMVLFHEEPHLRKLFGEEYDRFCAAVPRWLPRVRPWRGSTA